MDRCFTCTLILAIFFALAACESAFGQECPQISISGPVGITLPGDSASFHAKVETNGQHYDLGYVWSVIGGEITGEQGTSFLSVRVSADIASSELTATVNITGLPEGCVATASETVGCRLTPPAVFQLEEFITPIAAVRAERLDRIVKVLEENPDAQLYVLAVHGKVARVREQDLLEFLNGRGINSDRVTIVPANWGVDLLQLWLVPPGATPPAFDPPNANPRSRQCPTISVSSPAGITRSGEIATFAVSIDGIVPPNVTSRWEVQGAEVVRQTQLSVDVRSSNYCIPVKAMIIFDGLPSDCATNASDTYEAICEPVRQKLDEFIGPLSHVSPTRFQHIRESLAEHPNAQIYVLFRFRPAKSSALRTRKERLLEKIGRDEGHRVTFVDAPGRLDLFEIWLVPPGTTAPTP